MLTLNPDLQTATRYQGSFFFSDMIRLHNFLLRMEMSLQFRLTCIEQVTLRHWNNNSPQREAEWVSLVTQMAARE